MASIFLTREAKDHFDLLPRKLQDVVENTLAVIEMDPESAGKPLLGRLKGLWSCRVGNYRILYTIETRGRSTRVIVRAIKHRAVAYGTRRTRK